MKVMRGKHDQAHYIHARNAIMKPFVQLIPANTGINFKRCYHSLTYLCVYLHMSAGGRTWQIPQSDSYRLL